VPKLVIHPDDLPEIPKAAKQWLLAQAVNLVTRSPLGTVALAQYHIQHFFWDKFGVRLYSPTGRGGFIPVYDRDHPFWIQRFGAPLAASPTRTTPPQSGGKREAPQRASGDAKHRRAHQCPKGHYWSYTKKRCLKSKYTS